MQLQTGLGGAFALGTWPGTNGTSANASPQGPMTAAQQGFGVQAGGAGKVSGRTIGVLSTSTISLALLVYIWWSLPR